MVRAVDRAWRRAEWEQEQLKGDTQVVRLLGNGENTMMEFKEEEVRELMKDGFFPAFIVELAEGDTLAIPPQFGNEQGKFLYVTRILDRETPMSFIGYDLENLPHHECYGYAYPCFIKRDVNVVEEVNDDGNVSVQASESHDHD